MAYTRAWNLAVPGNVPANTLDNEIRNLKFDLEERFNDLIGGTNWTDADDPIIDGSTIKSLATLTAEIATKPSINASDGTIPVRASAGTFGNSNIQSVGTAVTIGGASLIIAHGNIAIRSVTYSWPATQGAAATILQNDGSGGLSWTTIGSLGGGDITGGGTIGKIAKFDAAKNIVDSALTESGGNLSLAGNITSTAGSLIAGTNSLASVGGLVINNGDATVNGQIRTVAGNVDLDAGVVRIASTQVVRARVTGWGAPTGTATRSTFATGSVTTAQLAERVKALIDDLTTHGLIGA